MANICVLDHDCGSHIKFMGSLYKTIQEGLNLGLYSIQFFMGSPQNFNRAKITERDIIQSRQLLASYNMGVYTHFPYVSNLCGSITCLVWESNKTEQTEQTEQTKKTMIVLQSLEYELSVIAGLSLEKSGVVIHPGNYPDRKKGIYAISQSINKINFVSGSKLILENSAGQGCSLATTLFELKTILDNIDEKKKEHIGICIDTCHLYAYGEYDISKCTEIDRFFNDFNSIIGLEYLCLIHLNDSVTPLGSRKDRHACLGEGYIWKDTHDSLFYLLKKCKENSIPCVLETEIQDIFKLCC